MSQLFSPVLRPMYRTLATGGAAVIAAAALVACQPAVTEAQATAAPVAQPLAVTVAPVVTATIDAATPQVGRVEAAQRVELQPRVAGLVDAVLFREGDLVRVGQPLFQIDPRPFDAALARSRAELELARARESLAATEAERARQLHAERAIAAEEFERRSAAHAEARARRAAAEAALQTAQLDRDFTLVRSPIHGRIGRALITAGNVVSAGSNATVLASLVSVAPLHVHFDVADRGVIEQLAAQRGTRGWTARILDADGQRELAQAPIDFSNHSIDAATGTLRLRARVDRAQAQLMPGQYVRVQLVTGRAAPALMVPDKAIGTDQGQRFVLVVDAQGQVQYRPVSVGAAHAQQRIVTAGLQADERVIVSGLMRIRPGMTVRPQLAVEPVEPVGSAASAPQRS